MEQNFEYIGHYSWKHWLLFCNDVCGIMWGELYHLGEFCPVGDPDINHLGKDALFLYCLFLTPTHCFIWLSMFQNFLLNWDTNTRCVCFPIDPCLFPAIAELSSFQSRQGYSPGGTADFLISDEALSRKAYTCLHPDTSSEIRRTALCTIRSN